MPVPLWAYAAVAVPSTGVALLLNRRKPNLPRTGRPSERSSGPVQFVLGETRTGGLRSWRVVDDSGRQYTTMENAPEQYRDVHLAIALSAGACEGLRGLWLGEAYYPLARLSVESDGAVLYNSTRRAAPYSSRLGNLFEARSCFAADGTQGAVFREVAGISASVPFLTGISWAHVVLRQPSNAGDPNRVHKYQAIPEIEFLMRGMKLPDAADPDASPRWTDDATDIRHWYMTQRMGVLPGRINAASVTASKAVTGATVRTALDGAWWGYAEEPQPPNAAYASWSSDAPALTAGNPVLWAAWAEKADLDDASPLDQDIAASREWTVVPHRVRRSDGTEEALAGLPEATEADILYQAAAAGYDAKRYTINGVVDASQRHEDVLGEMDFAWQGGVVLGADGDHHFRPGADRAPARAWTASGVLSRGAVVGARIDRAANVVHAGVEQSRMHRYARHDLPPLKNDPAVARDGIELPVRLRDMTLVNDPITAGRLLATFLRRSRQTVAYPYRVGPDPAWQSTNPGDVLTVTDPFYGIQARRMTVSEITVAADASVAFTLVDTPAGAFADTVDPDTPEDRPVVVNPVPVPADVTIEARAVNLADGRSRAMLAVGWTTQPYRAECRYRITGLQADGPVPAEWARDPNEATRTGWRTAELGATPPGLLSAGVDWGHTFQAQLRFAGPSRPGPWAAAVSVAAVPTLAETPVDADAVIAIGRILLVAAAPKDRTISGCQFLLTAAERIDVSTITEDMVATAVAAGLAPIVPVQPGETVEGSTTRIPETQAGAPYLGAAAARFIGRTGARSAWAAVALAAPGGVQVPPDGYVVLLDRPATDADAGIKGRLFVTARG